MIQNMIGSIIQTGTSASLQAITVSPATTLSTYFPGTGCDGFSQVTVNAVTSSIDNSIQAANIVSGATILSVAGTAIELSSTTSSVNPATTSVIITPGGSYNGFSQVTVNSAPLETTSVSLTTSSSVVNTGANYYGMSKVTVVAALQSQTISPLTTASSYYPGTGYCGMSVVTVSAVTSAIDSNIVGTNIKSGVKILGVTGTYTGSGGTSTVVSGTISQASAASTLSITGLLFAPSYVMVTYNPTSRAIGNIYHASCLSGTSLDYWYQSSLSGFTTATGSISSTLSGGQYTLTLTTSQSFAAGTWTYVVWA